MAADPFYRYLQALRHIKLPFPAAGLIDENQKTQLVRRKLNAPFEGFWAWPQTAVALLQSFPQLRTLTLLLEHDLESMQDLRALVVLESELGFEGEKRIECVYRIMWPENGVVRFGEDVQEYLMARNWKIIKLVESQRELTVEPLEMR